MIHKLIVSDPDMTVVPWWPLDEPDLHLGLDYQDHLWSKIISVVSQSYQVIVATHSPFAVSVPGATYLETTPGYLDRCRANLKRALGC